MFKNRLKVTLLLEILMVFMSFYSVIAVALCTYCNNLLLPVYKGLLLVIPIIISELYLLQNPKLASARHLFPIICALILGFSFAERTIYFTLVFLVIYSRTSRKKLKSYALFIGGEFLFICCYFFSVFRNFTSMYPLLNAFCLIYILIYFLYSHIKGLDSSLDIITKNTIQPVDSIRKFNLKIISLFLMVVFLISLIVPKLYIGELFVYWGRLLFNFLASKWNVKVPSINIEQLSVPIPVIPFRIPTSTSQNAQADSPLTRLFVSALSTITQILLLLLIVAVITFIMYYVYKLLSYKETYSFETKEKLSPFQEEEKIKHEFNFFKKTKPAFTSSIKDKIRKIYFKQIKHFIKKGVDIEKSYTSGEISDKVKKTSQKNIDDLTHYYNKARYSNTECTNQDLNAVEQSLSSKTQKTKS